MTAGRSRSDRRGRSRWQWLKDAFSLESSDGPLTDRELALLDRIASFLVRKRMSIPAILFLESVKPLNYVGSQAMAFFEPVVRILFAGEEYSELQRILERRESIEVLLQRIELAESADASSESTGSDDVVEDAAERTEVSNENEVHESR